jgi:ElaB/YqjD/DUF883 family membrane-anchored ribosome-binding protein
MATATRTAPVDTARALSSTVQEKVQSTRRALKRLREDAFDTYDEALFQVKRHPGKALAIGVGAGVCAGLGIGILLGRGIFGRRRSFFGR